MTPYAVMINGKDYEVFKDKEGVLRFKPDNLINKLHIFYDIKASDLIKLVELDSISLEELLDYYAGIGFTVSGVEELSFFQDWDFVFTNADQ